tara:strand:+ start:381 stop:560 length:180 start_codon:yes stop_codon:yes gene_type:complete
MRIMVMRWLDVGSIPKQRRRIFALDGYSQVVPSFPIFILSFTNFPKENNAEYNGNHKNE